jgi:hypothetical protein
MEGMADEGEIRRKFEALSAVMDERMRRLWAGAEAEFGDGGIAVVERATGMSRTTIRTGRDELRGGVSVEDVVNVRRPGGGRISIEEQDPDLVTALEALVDPVTRGDPMSPLRWTSKSTRKLAEEMAACGYEMSPQKVGQLLRASGYSLQGTNKTTEGAAHPDRNGQFEFINERVDAWHSRGGPVISVDTKKKELVGDFKNAGKSGSPKANRSRFASMTSSTRILARRFPTASTTSDSTTRGSVSASTTTRRSSPSNRSRDGGATWGRRHIPMRPSC